ncbi:hypothetical protein KSP39_PZI021359 [Platanthera zijinensis]|uniref:Uncharacterized protein n=1 Tax=Platanthera zijinensis TaxID=2320716 RepID=A0AAP0AYM7_9ASPA
MKDMGPLRYFLGLEISHSKRGLLGDFTIASLFTRTSGFFAISALRQSLPVLSATSPLTLRAYSDADWAGDVATRRSTTGFCIFLGDSLISWRSKKQDSVARSSTEAEYRAMASTTAEIVWLLRLLCDFGVQISDPTPLFCDNRSAIQIASNPVFHEWTKHIEIDCHFTRQKFLANTISLPFIASEEQVADFLIKSLTSARFRYLISKLSVHDSP